MEERPIECSQCRKRADVLYKEMVEGEVTTWKMCHDCPILHAKLKGKARSARGAVTVEEAPCCDRCRTLLESISMGGLLGCEDCYQAFQDALTDQLIETHRLPSRLVVNPPDRTSTLHVGRAPDEGKTPEASRIQDLNEALSEALKMENYEEAAWLRDQINVLMEKLNEKA